MKQLSAYKHSGFWQPMDTLRDKTTWKLWNSGNALEGVVIGFNLKKLLIPSVQKQNYSCMNLNLQNIF